MTAIADMLEDLASAPTPYHAVEQSRRLLTEAGFVAVDQAASLPNDPGSYFTSASGTLVAWIVPPGRPSGFTIVGAHTDSPNLRVRTNAEVTSAGMDQVGMEVYGGVLLNSWLDRDLGLAGRVMVSEGEGAREILMIDDRPILRVPQLAIHLDREIRENGLKLNPQTQMTPLWSMSDPDGGTFAEYVARHVDVATEDVVSWDLMAFDVQPPSVVGLHGEFLASARIDNLLSSFCGVRALIDVSGSAGGDPLASVPVLVLYDHEEVGSQSATGAAGSMLSNLLERISGSMARDRIAHLESLAASYVVSADGAHATHPNYVDKHEPNHLVELNAGVVVKRNANQRYASDAASEAPFRRACADAGVPVQTYIHRNDLPCGSTIGPITAAALGVPTVDVGAPQLAMHSIREMSGVDDVSHLRAALSAIWRSE